MSRTYHYVFARYEAISTQDIRTCKAALLPMIAALRSQKRSGKCVRDCSVKPTAVRWHAGDKGEDLQRKARPALPVGRAEGNAQINF